jgi:hypothetical protein
MAPVLHNGFGNENKARQAITALFLSSGSSVYAHISGDIRLRRALLLRSRGVTALKIGNIRECASEESHANLGAAQAI